MPATPADSCERFADLLDARADGELPDGAAAELDAHLATCAACAAEAAAIGALRAELAGLRRDTAPEEMHRRLRAGLPEAEPDPGRRRALGLAAASFGGALLGAAGARFLAGASPGATAEHDLAAAHARALLADLPPQVATGDPHRVRPWLSTRVPVAPRVLESEDFPLQGARLDLVAAQPVAAVLYRRRAHAVTVFSAPAAAARDWPGRPVVRGGFNLLPWTADGVRYVAVSDLNLAELAVLAGLLGAKPP
jgi:anti-sigma factor RsiW